MQGQLPFVPQWGLRESTMPNADATQERSDNNDDSSTDKLPREDLPVSPQDLSTFQKEILIVLAHEEPTYGLGIKYELEEEYEEEINHGRVYPNLDDLVEMGLVKKTKPDKRTNNYALTSDSRFLLRNQSERLSAATEQFDNNGGVDF